MILLNIKNPTIINAGAVAKDGIAVKIGAKNMEIKNNTAVTSAVSPVLPPANTPAEDSTNVVVVDVPNTAPALVAIASAISADLILGNLPFSSNTLAFVFTPISVPNVSNKSTNKNENTTTMKLKIPTPSKSILKHWPKVSPSFEKSVSPKEGYNE